MCVIHSYVPLTESTERHITNILFINRIPMIMRYMQRHFCIKRGFLFGNNVDLKTHRSSIHKVMVNSNGKNVYEISLSNQHLNHNVRILRVFIYSIRLFNRNEVFLRRLSLLIETGTIGSIKCKFQLAVWLVTWNGLLTQSDRQY